MPPASPPPLIENASSSLLRADRYVYRLNPGDEATVDLYLTKFGKPAAGETIALAYAPQLLPAEETVGDPEECADVPHANDPRQDRWTRMRPLHAQGSRPGQPVPVHRRPGLWSRLLLAVGAAGPDPGRPLAVRRRWSGAQFTFTPPATWWGTVQPILSQYARLYPFMMQFVDLGDYQSVVDNRSQIVQVMGLDPEQPGYMPVTRDLSRTSAR